METKRRTRRPRPARYRHPGDIFRVVTGLAVLAGLSVLAAGGVLTRPERTMFRLLNDLPGWLDGPMRVVTQAGWVGAVPIAGAVAVLARRRRLAIDLGLAGGAAWVLAKMVKDVAHRGRPGVLLEEVILRGVPATGHGFVSGHAAVAAALATVASSEVSRRTRRALWALVWAVAGARVYSGAHLPLDVLGGAALGWALGAGVHLVRGTPGHAPPVATVLAGLTRSGLDVQALRPLHADARGSVPFVGDAAGGGVFVKAVGRDQRDADLLFRIGRWLAFREVGDEAPLATAKQQIEHEAYLLLAAARAGARVPDLLTTAEADDGIWLLAERRVAGTDASQAPTLGNDVLTDIWRQLVALRTARIAHRDLRLANVLIGTGGEAWLVDFGFAQAGASDDQLARDVAELLASTATAVGAGLAVAAASAAVGPDALREAAPLLQPLALSTATRRQLAAQPGALERLRDAMATAGAPVDPRRLLRVRLRPSMLVAVAAGGYATHHLLIGAAGASSVASLLADGRWRWVAAATAGGLLPFLFAAIALAAAAGRRLALGRTVASQLASTLASRGSASSHAGAEVSAAYLCAAGMPAREAEDAVDLTRAAGFAVHTIALVAAGGLALAEGIRVAEPPRPAALVVAALVVALAAGALGWLPASRRALARAAVRRLRLLRRLRTDGQSARLLLAQVALTASLALSLLAALRAVSVSVPIAAAVTLYLASSALAASGPLPGGLGVVEPALAAGLMVLGVPAAPAVAAVIVFRAVTYWVPLVPAALAYRRLRRQGCC
ncbi:lysylphosphatidylglycerol synthase domain-containing protein [Actinomarinicola tropica]|nr:lysylphosphatidylglycerol synthase domain-containing protein [Actinomarinicola tropica]